MKHKRTISTLIALSLVVYLHLTTPKNEDATRVQLINSDLVMLTISSFKQVNEQVKQCSHNSNCYK